jgi:hypothetical protein
MGCVYLYTDIYYKYFNRKFKPFCDQVGWINVEDLRACYNLTANTNWAEIISYN